MLANGNFQTEPRPVQINNCILILSNTCAHDSIMQVLLSTAAGSTYFFDYLNNEIKENKNTIDEKLFSMVIDILVSGINQTTYILRGGLMQKYFKISVESRPIVHINCKTFIDTLSEFLLSKHPSLSITHHCSRNESHVFLDEKINLLIRFEDLRDEKNFQKFLIDRKYLRSKGKLCLACDGKTSSSANSGEF